jgi:hypothetical protein
MSSLTLNDLGLQSLPEDTLIPPECRMQNAATVVDCINRAIEDDYGRSRKRAKVDGLVDGNPPQNPRRLRDFGMAKATNVNFGTARSFLATASDAIYDLATQAPALVQIEVEHGTPGEAAKWGRIMSEEVDLAIAIDEDWDVDDQDSQNEMVLHGCGPLIFENNDDVLPIAISTDNFKIPDMTPSKPSRWEMCFAIRDYYPPELYRFIVDEAAAKAVGWRVNFTKKIIAGAMDEKSPDNQTYTWEWYQNQLKTNSLQYQGDLTKVCKMAHAWWREFPKPGERQGKITHAIVERTGGANPGIEYCYLHVGRYETWKEAVHPMYYDRGRAGLHHNVTGLGVKMYSTLKLQNIAMSHLFDTALSPKTLFTTTTEQQWQQSAGVQLFDSAILKPGITPVQNPISGFVQEGLKLVETTDQLMRSNTSQYQQPVQPDKPGNPDTATEVKRKAMQQASIGGAQFSRWYRQRDILFGEIVRRFFNLNSNDPRAKKCQERCLAKRVPKECFGRIRRVMAVRVVGQGSPFLRTQALGALAQVVGGFPETGQQNWRRDTVAAWCGHEAVSRYMPEGETSMAMADQKVLATLQVVAMKDGVAPVPSPSQNPITFAGVFLGACADALASLQKGGDPQKVSAFLDMSGPAAHMHIQRLSSDPIKKEVAGMLMKKWKRIAVLADKLKKHLQQQAEKQQQLRGKMQGQITDAQIKAQATAEKLKLAREKQAATLQMKREAHNQNLALADSRTAADITLAHHRALSE